MNQFFDFQVDKATNTIHITREFAADQATVWDAFTKAEILDQWVAPKPMRLETKELDFREGGRWHYAMISPDGAARYSLAEYLEIHPKNSYTTRNYFADEHGNPNNTVFSSSININTFIPNGEDKTTFKMVKKMSTLAELEQFVAGGHFERGSNMGYTNLDEYLKTVTSK